MNEDTKFVTSLAAGVIGILALGVFIYRSVEAIPAGQVGVQTRFGKVVPEELEPGLNFKNPLNSVTEFEVRLRETKEQMNVPTKEGMIAGLDVSILYHVIPAEADAILSKIGGEVGADPQTGKERYAYEDVVVEPYARNIVRDVVAEYSSEDLYSINREKISAQIRERLAKELGARGIVPEAVLLRDVRLPEQVTKAIEQKIKMKQESEQMEFVLSKARQEADRQRVEAQGIADAQKIISGSLSEEYLQWKFISTLESVEQGPNKTIVIIPFDQKLIPLLPIGTEK